MMNIKNMGGGLQLGALEGTKGVPKNANNLGGPEQSGSTGQDMGSMLKTIMKMLEAAMKGRSSSPPDSDPADDTAPTQPKNHGRHAPYFVDKTAAPGEVQAALGGLGGGSGIQ